MKVGIPRSLFFIEYMDFIVTFFESLDAEVVISSKTNKQILTDGTKVAVDDICLPVKLFHGHVFNLIGKVDYILAPSIISLYEGEHICPKFGGIPELISYSIKNLPELIYTNIDFYDSKKNLKESFYDMAKYITSDRGKINNAYHKSLYVLSQSKAKMLKGLLPIDSHFKNYTLPNTQISLLILGHSYNLYDSYSNMNLFNKLYCKGIHSITPEMIDKSLLDIYAEKSNHRLFWTFSKKLLGSTHYCIDHHKIDGIIYVTSFGCGIDSVLIENIQRISKRNNMPFLLLSIDEHTGEAGVNTRIEAFLDILERKITYENNLPPYGKALYNA